MEKEILAKILEALQPLCQSINLKDESSAYHTSCLQEIIELYKKVDNPFILSYPESIRVTVLDNVIEHIKKDLIEDKRNYLWRDDKPKNDYERGVLNAVRLIQFRVHCICD